MMSRGSCQVELLQTLRVHVDDVSCCDFGANYLLASGSGDKTVRVWEWKKGSGYVEKSYSPLGAHRYAVTSVRFSSLGTMLASSSTDGSTILWNVWSGVRIHTFVQRNGCPVRLSVFSPNSTLLISAGDDGAVCIWDLLRRTLIRSFQAHRTTIQAMAMTPDSKFLLTSDTDGLLKLWKDLEELPSESAPASPNMSSAPTLTESAEPADDSESLIMLVEDSHDMGVTGADFSLNHEVAAEGGTVKRYTLATCGNNSVVRVWIITVTLPGKPFKLEPVPSPTSPCRFGLGKKSLSARLSAPASPVDGESPPPSSPPASPNSLLGPQHSFRRRESSIKRRRRQCRIAERLTLGGHGSAVTSVRFSASGARLASSGMDKTVRLWEMPSGNCLHVLEGHGRFVACCAFSRDGALLASGSNDKQLLVWSVKGDVTVDSDLAVPMSVFRDKLNKSSKDNSVLPDLIKEGGPHAADAESDEGNVRDVRLLQRLDAHSSSVNSCHFHGNDQLVTAGGDKLLRLWRRSPAETRFVERTDISPIPAHTFSINQVEYSPCGRFIASCSADGSAVLWNARTGQRAPGSFATAGSSAIRACRFSPDGRLLVTAGDDERVSVWRTDIPELIMSFEGHNEAVVAMAVSPDNQFLATACSGGHVRGWSLLPCWDRCIMLTEDAHDLGVQSCDFSPQIDPQGYLLATCGNDSTVRLWRIPTELGVISTPTSSGGHSGLMTPPPASPLRSPKLAPSATPVRTLQGHGGNVMCVRFSPCSGEFLASTASDSTVRLWNVHQGDCLFVLEAHSRMVTCCAFSANATILATGSLDKTVILWKLPDHIAYQNTVASRLRGQHRRVLDWTPVDVCNWLKRSLEAPVNNALVYANDVDGCQLLTLPESQLETILDIAEQNRAELRRQIRWLRLEEMEVMLPEISSGANVPHDYLCPITREVMREPVTCADGFTYERAAIEEWFLSGKLTSPMTNTTLPSLAYRHHSKLKRAISEFLYGDSENGDCPCAGAKEPQ